MKTLQDAAKALLAYYDEVHGVEAPEAFYVCLSDLRSALSTPEVAEPVAWRVRFTTHENPWTYFDCEQTIPADGVEQHPVYAQPVPAPAGPACCCAEGCWKERTSATPTPSVTAPSTEAKDAARYRWLRDEGPQSQGPIAGTGSMSIGRGPLIMYWPPSHNGSGILCNGPNADAFIDAAMNKTVINGA